MQVWNVLHMARWKYRTQSAAKKWPSAHDRTTLSSWIFATKACIDNRKKKLVDQQYLLHTSSQYGELLLTSSWDQFGVWAPQQIQRVLRGFCVLALLVERRRSPEANQTLHDIWPSPGLLHYIYTLSGALVPWRNFATCEIHFASKTSFVLHWQHSCMALQQRGQPNFTAWYKEWNCGTFAEGATYIRLGGHHVWHWPTF